MQKRVAKDGSKKVASFFKRNIYYVLMVVCVVAIGAMITVAAVVNKNNEAGGGTTVVVPPGGDDGDTPIVKPEEFVLQMPVASGVVARAYNDSKLLWDETSKSFRTHVGVDFKIAAGTDVVAVFGGVVEDVTKDSVYGTTVVIDHKNGYKSTMRLLKDSTMSKGKIVKKGDVIGKVSGVMSFELASGEHIHLELTKDGKILDPMQFIPSGNK